MLSANGARTSTGERRRIARGHVATFTLGARIGTSGPSDVYEASDPDGRPVTLNVLRADLAYDPAWTDRFVRDGYLANRLGHPGLMRAVDHGYTARRRPFYVTERPRGETLEEVRVRAGGRLPWTEATAIAIAILDVVAACHAASVAHGRIEPDTIAILDDGAIKLLGLGEASISGSGAGAGLDPKGDVAGVGATLLSLLAGGASRGPTGMPDVPPEIAAVIAQALDPDLGRRFADARAMAAALTHAVGSAVARRAPVASAPKKERAPVSERSLPTARKRAAARRPAWLVFLLGLSIAAFATSFLRLVQVSSASPTMTTATATTSGGR